jgi:predicted membrane metal-binding protein
LKNKGFLGWKEGLSITIAAQLAVAPILISQFGNFTLTSFISNILILFTVPVVMVLGYLASIIYYLFLPLAIFISWIISFILSYQILIINIFSKLAISFNPPLNIWVIIIYYLLLATIVYIFKRYETL